MNKKKRSKVANLPKQNGGKVLLKKETTRRLDNYKCEQCGRATNQVYSEDGKWKCRRCVDQ